jgi:hypothetical protein
MRRCKDEKIRYRPPVLEEPCAQTLSAKSGMIQKTLKNTTPQSSRFNTQPTPHSFIYLHATSHTPHSILYTSNSSFNTPHFFLLHTPYYTHSTRRFILILHIIAHTRLRTLYIPHSTFFHSFL